MKALLPADALVDEMQPLPASLELAYMPDLPSDTEFLVLGGSEMAPQARHIMSRMPGLRVLQTISAGVDWLRGKVPPGVTLCNASGIHDVGVSEWVVGAILAMRRRLFDFWDLQQRGQWYPNAEISRTLGLDDLEGKTVLIVGHGSIGRALEARLAPFGTHVIGLAKHPRPGVGGVERLPDLLPQADIVVLLAPLTPETRGLVNAEFLAKMRPGALLVNPARGGLVDTEALEAALRAGHIRAALDVTDPEPLPEGHSLWTAPNLMITPHVAGTVGGLQGRAYRFVGGQLRRYVAGEPLLNVRTGDY